MRKRSFLFSLIALIVFMMSIKSTAEVLDQLKQAQTFMNNRQYTQAEKLYLQILAENPGSDAALEAQKQLVLIYIATENQPQAEVVFQQLITNFSQHKGIAEAIWRIARSYSSTGDKELELSLHQYNVEHFPQDVNAVFSQVEIIKHLLRKGDDTASNAAIGSFLTAFSGQPTLPKAIYHVARRYDEFGKYDKAIQLHCYNAENFFQDKHAIWSMAEIIFFYIRNNQDAAADAAFNELLTIFSGQPTLSNEIYQVAKRYNDAGKIDKAIQLHQYNVRHFPSDIHAMRSQVEIIFSYIRNDKGDAADAAFDELVNVFSSQPTLSKEVYEVAKMFSKTGENNKAQKLNQYLINRWSDSDDPYTSWYVAMAQNALGYEANTTEIIDNLFSSAKDNSNLSEMIFSIGEQYWYQAMSNRQNGLKDKAKEDFAKALVVWERIVEELPNHSSASNACYFSAECYYHMGQYEKAVEYFQKVLNDWSNYKYGWSAYGFLGASYDKLKKSGRITESQADPLIEQAYKAVIDKYPECRMIDHCYLKLAKLTSRKKRWSEAAKYYGAFLNNYPKDKRYKHILYSLGRTYEQMGELENAAQIYQLVIQQGNPEDSRVKNSMRRLARITEGTGK